MEALGKYILSVTSAALLLSIFRSILGEKSSATMLLQLIGGLFLAFTIISPVADLDFRSLVESSMDIQLDGNAIAAHGQAISQNELATIIKERCETYILDKAKSLGVSLEAVISLSDDEMPIPVSVRMQGVVSPYAKGMLEEWLQIEMGIPREDQLWIAP